jgi:hypothetical protein
MKDHIIVCPYNEKLLTKLKRRALVVNTDDFNIIRYIEKEVNKSGKLHAIKIQTDKSLSDIHFEEDWINLPLAIYSSEFGEYKDFLHQLNIIKKLNVRIFLSSQNDFNFIGLRILSSLNISCGLHFSEVPFSWDSINDLMHYAIYTRTKHAPIEPFNWLASNYEPTGYTDFNIVYFNNPARYLHVNENEQIALTREDMLNNIFIAEGIKSLDSIHENINYLDFFNHRYNIMLQMNECAFCPAFRICLAKYPNLLNKKETCKVFFSDLLEAADFAYSNRISNNGNPLWQL